MDYVGADNLEAMKQAKNYNSWLVEKVIENMPAKAEKIIDFGAGNGSFAKEVEKQSNKKVVCVEPAENMQEHLLGLEKVKSLEFLADNEADFIYSLNVLEHIEKDEDVLRLLRQKIKKGGVILIYVPAFTCLYSAMDKEVGHFRRYEKADLLNKVSATGFKVTDCRYEDFVGWFAAMLFKLVSKKSGKLDKKSVWFYDRFVFPLSRLADFLSQGRLLGKNLLLVAKKE